MTRDQANLQFLLTLTSEALANWYAQASEDDIEYASELLDAYEQELDTLKNEMDFEEHGYVFQAVKTIQ